MERDSVSMVFVRSALARLAPAARVQVLQGAGIAPDLVTHPDARVSARSFGELWMGVARALDDEFFGLDARRMKVGSFALLCHSLIDCEDLERALRQMLRGFGLFLDDVRAELHCEGEVAEIRLHNRIGDPEARRFADETLLVMIHGLLCWLAGKRIALREAAFAWSQPAHVREYHVMFCETLRFEATQTGVRLDARVLRGRVAQTRASLKTFLRNAPQSVFLKYKNTTSWTARLKRRLRHSLGQTNWPTLEAVAGEFHVAASTLRRRLEAEGTSYQGLKDELRRDAAIHHLAHSRRSMAEIASLLGFQEPSAFHRAFKKWSGVQPGEYRERAASEVRVGRV